MGTRTKTDARPRHPERDESRITNGTDERHQQVTTVFESRFQDKKILGTQSENQSRLQQESVTIGVHDS